MDTPKYTELALLINDIGAPDRLGSSPASTWKIEFITVSPTIDKPRNIGTSWDTAHHLQGYEGLVIRMHLFGDSDSHNWGMVYLDIYSADLRDLERRVKACKALDRKLEKIASEFGSPQTAAEFVTHVMSAAGIKRSFRHRDHDTPARSNYDDNDWRSCDAASTRYLIERMRREWYEVNGKKKEEADAA